MKKSFKFFLAIAISLLMTGCGIYNKYQSEAQVPADAYGTMVNGQWSMVNGQWSLAQMSWREFFTDPLLQQLIDSVLTRNTDLHSARIAISQSEASLRAARMAYLPSLHFTPSGTIASFDHSPATKTYNLPLQLSMDLDVFGSITNQKRKSQALHMQAQLGEEILRANLISIVAQQYFMLQVLDHQLHILTVTDSLWRASLSTEKTLWENGKIYSTAVNQMESSYLNVKTQIVDTRRNILSVENSLCRLLALTPRHIQRSHWGSSALPHHPQSASDDTGQRMFDTRFLKVGVPAQLLEYRPDVRMADYRMAEAFYNTQAARAAFYPGITLSGTAGWTNSAGSIVVDPGRLLLSAVASLTQPLFARGRLTANLKIAKLTQDDIQRKYVQTVIDAGNQVNEALADLQAAREKHAYYHRQVEVLRQAYKGTHELMDNGKANYLEVLTAQESLLSAQLSEAMNMYNGAQAIIALYIALGGGTK
ncbi:MAG: TolC family protein [Bacteroidaceae bacterium]|nr:TolC family protein [Bacteroidaceae bacterium]